MAPVPTRSLRPLTLLALALALAACGASKKSCDAGLTACGDQCVDTQTDALHCGGCLSSTSVCPTGAACTAGACACPAGQTACNGACVDLTADANDCGACGVKCGLGTCSGGTCTCQGSPVIACSTANPRCVDPTSDPANCGACGKACLLSGEACQSSTCACPASAPDQCPGACVNLDSDVKNCGACGQGCTIANEVCASRQCQCLSPNKLCGSGSSATCSDPSSDSSNCGACGNVCSGGRTCQSGACACPSGQTLCNGTCVSTTSDPSNCGACGTVCSSGLSCIAAKCGTKQCGSTICSGGTQCCSGSTCQLAHVNGPPALGLGQTYFDCSALGDPSVPGSYTAAMASEAAAAWAPDGVSTTAANGLCVARLNRDRTLCAQWCWSSGLDGYGTINAVGGGNPGCMGAQPGAGALGGFTWD